MSYPKEKTIFEKFFGGAISLIKPQKKYVSDFVKAQQALNNRASKWRLLWDSSNGRTYVRKKHGALRRA
jgi:hypothetical protein